MRGRWKRGFRHPAVPLLGEIRAFRSTPTQRAPRETLNIKTSTSLDTASATETQSTLPAPRATEDPKHQVRTDPAPPVP